MTTPTKASGEEGSQSRIDEALSYYHTKRDVEENQKTRPPVDERIVLHSIWVVEVYLPSQVNELIEGVTALGWAEEEPGDKSRDLADWIDKAARSLSWGGWMPLHIVTRPDDDKFALGSPRHAPLPETVDYAMGSLQQLFPGLLALVMQFVLRDEAAAQIEDELRLDRRTTATSRESRTWFLTPANQKIGACRQTRERLRQVCASWFRSHLPGYFSSLGNDGKFPTAEFITLTVAHPYVRPGKREWPDYLWVLRMDHDIDAWRSDQLPGVSLCYGESDMGSPFALTLATREEEFFRGEDEDSWKSWGGRNRSGYANRLQFLDRSLAVWALHALLGTLERRFASLRNDVAAIELADIKTSTRQLERAQTELLTLSRDVLPVAAELEDFCSERARFHMEVYEFTPVNDVRKNQPPLFEGLRMGLSRRASRLQEFEHEVRDAATSQGALVATISQNRATDNIVKLTIAIVVLTAVVAGLTGWLAFFN